MISKLESQYRHIEYYTYIETEFLREFEERLTATDNDFDGLSTEQMIEQIRSVSSSRRTESSRMEDIESMSLEEIRRRYEEQILREKYGDEYDEIMNKTHEDFLRDTDDDFPRFLDDERVTHEDPETYSGPALVFVDLENKERGHLFVEVPVFTCLDGGVVVLNITVSPDGRVIRTSVESVSDSADSSCLIRQARQAALNSRFRPVTHRSNERGTITYHFIPQ